MKRTTYFSSTVLFLASVLFSVPGFAGENRVERFVREDPLRSAGNLHCYEVLDSSVTKAPGGYRPFYVSHISRHGSRSHNEKKTFSVVDSMTVYAERGLLTQDGLRLAGILSSIKEANERNGYGNLTDRGAWEHRNIAGRLGRHYPEIFSDPSRNQVNCYSTSVGRVLESRRNFVEELSSAYPGLHFNNWKSKDSDYCRSQVYADISSSERKELSKVPVGRFRDSLLRITDWSRLNREIFVEGRVPATYPKCDAEWYAALYRAGCIRQCFMTDTLGWVEPWFSPDELYALWCYANIWHCQSWGWTEENRGYRVGRISVILENILKDADEAVAGSDTCATLRFTHDSMVFPLLCLVGVDGCEWHGSYKQMNEHCCVGYSVRMAGNLQMIFFRGRKGDVLVKLLLNEQETLIPALKPDRKGVFYDWNRLRAYLQSCIDEIRKENHNTNI